MINPTLIKRVDRCLASLPEKLAQLGISLQQRDGYKAGKLSAKKNWCQLNDEAYNLRRCFIENSRGDFRYRKILAHFGKSPQSQLWELLKPYTYKEAKWMPTGSDVCGISYERLAEYLQTHNCEKLLRILSKELKDSLNYLKRHYG